MKESIAQLNTALSNRGFTVNTWLSNVESILEKFSENLSMQHLNVDKALNTEGTDGVKALGLHYDYRNDQLYSSLNNDLSPSITKREVLCKIMSIYDAIGLLEP